MSSTRLLLIDLCVILVLSLYFVIAEERNPGKTKDEGPKGNCSCGGFPTQTPDVGALPILSQSPGLIVKCNDEGSTICKNLCTALATATKAKGPEILCNRLKNANELKLSAFYKACDNPWTYANMTAEAALCCDDGKVKTCASAAASSSNTSAIVTGKPLI